MNRTNASKIYNFIGAEAVLTEAEDLRKYLTGRYCYFFRVCFIG